MALPSLAVSACPADPKRIRASSVRNLRQKGIPWNRLTLLGRHLRSGRQTRRP